MAYDNKLKGNTKKCGKYEAIFEAPNSLKKDSSL
jgi:hypothetical protein